MTIYPTIAQRAEALATQFATLNREVITFVEQCPTDLWQQFCYNDHRSMAVVAHHIATSHAMLAGLVGLIAQGQPLPPITMELLDQANAQHAQQFTHCTQTEVAALLRANGAAAATQVNQLSDQQLDRSTYIALFGADMNTQQVIEQVLIGHASSHLADLRATLGASRESAE